MRVCNWCFQSFKGNSEKKSSSLENLADVLFRSGLDGEKGTGIDSAISNYRKDFNPFFNIESFNSEDSNGNTRDDEWALVGIYIRAKQGNGNSMPHTYSKIWHFSAKIVLHHAHI